MYLKLNASLLLPVCLPTPTSELNLPNTDVVVIGYGKSENDTYPSNLRQVNLTVRFLTAFFHL